MLTPNTCKTEASNELSNSVAEFLANGGVVTKIKTKKVKVSMFTAKTMRRMSNGKGSNHIARTNAYG
jgi:hypothetical protein